MAKLRAFPLFIITVIIIFLAQLFYFYSGLYIPPVKGMHDTNIEISMYPVQSLAEGDTNYRGTVVVDMAHDNSRVYETLSNLLALVIERGGEVRFNSNNTKQALEEASAYIILLPQEEYSNQEIISLDNFRKNGGKILLINDPDVTSKIETVSTAFDVVFEDNYIYHSIENDINFKNVVFSKNSDHSLLQGVEKVIFYTSCSIRPVEQGLLVRDAYTSNREELSRVAPLVMGNNVLGLCDKTFLMPPYNEVVDNQALLSNIAAWMLKPMEPNQTNQSTEDNSQNNI